MADKQPESTEAKQAQQATPDQPADGKTQASNAAEQPTTKAEKQATKPDPQAAELAELKQKSSAMEDKYLRAEAEIQNMQTRFQKEQATLIKYDGQQLAKDILPVIDNLERALAVEAKDEAAAGLKKGVQMTYDHLEDALKRNHVTEVAALGQKFDPTLHQAVQTVPASDDQPAETVVQVLQKGYQLKDRVLRPAMVVVAQ
ncbi:nucleotide exchange factor GrpE [Levilactobacillus zymae]|uniref:Protein GrpE n=1 Tax=Levilactobacillus zymae TaxID=267363 RepID=A0A1Y6JYF8_9LACO|nr:nucleotide exchange factor GrpE [Levilactobacillus zymae]KRL15520.1 molecular chaperone GrpE (heat shock protein) [Levilactobacillus zymae DSM 19395]QFR60812.1 nucleotide exchange factor GrpE [Levilactobacillus zymae]GEO71033.1 protein GrpE [Levilactobacillus zymae]SMS14142.1 Heat shock protein GrpE [Levilactobacillus zymae]